MEIKLLFFVLFAVVCSHQAQAQSKLMTSKDGSYSYEYVEGDPMQTRIYTLANGLKVYMSVNRDEPRVQTAIAIRAGSKHDPRSNTGLAHYLEHMVFKGTSKIGSLNWEAEKLLLKQISDKYEEYARSTTPEARTAVYKQIDSLSVAAAQYVAANEYDKMTTSLGAEGTNAFTSTGRTVYINDIPSNALAKWAMLESERFSELVLRIFHTELETVYEEFNMSQDRDGSKTYEATLKALFPTHPYNISTIGLGEHLKNPSMVAIHQFFDKYYVPNNMAICLSGDIYPSSLIQLIDRHFGKLKAKPFADETFPTEAPIEPPLEVSVFGKEAESINITYRLDGSNSSDEMYINLLDGILQNGTAGIMDINLLQQQKVLSGGTYSNNLGDYSTYTLTGRPREGQSLEEVRNLLLSQIDLLKKGDFGDWLLPATIRNYKLSEYRQMERNDSRASIMFDAFIEKRNWADVVDNIAQLEKITKADMVKFFNERLKNNYVVVYKRQGDDPSVMKVNKPAISEVPLNREAESDFLKKFSAIAEDRQQPVFLDYKKDIIRAKLKNGIPYYYTKNTENPTFYLYYILDMGSNHDKKMGLAARYLQYLGTDKLSSAQMKEEWYKLGLSFNVSTTSDRIYVSLSGLDESMEAGIALLEQMLSNSQPNEEALAELIKGIIKERSNAKKDKRAVFGRLTQYGMYGAQSEATNVLSDAELKALTASELADLVKKMMSYKHYIYYYGSKERKEVVKLFNEHHRIPKKLLDYPQPVTFTEQETQKDKVLFVHYDMVQAQIAMLSKGNLFDKNLVPYSSAFNEYFGSGLSSIVFQEIRESRALAYSAYAFYAQPQRPDRSHYVNAFMAVQADKMKEALSAMRGLLNDMPKADKQFEGARLATLKKIETERITRTSKFFNYLSAQKLGLDYDLRKDVYAKAQTLTLNELGQFFDQQIKKRPYTFVVMGNRNTLDMETLKAIGDFKELSLEELFGY